MLRAAAIVFGASFLFGAAVIVLAACGVVPSAQGFTAGQLPLPVFVTAIFATVGTGCVLWGLGFDAIAAILIRCSVAMVAAGFILALNWVAFGPGAREFGISVGLPGGIGGLAPMDAKTNEWVGRSFFGIVAAVFDVIVLVVGMAWAAYWYNRLRRRGRSGSR